ncbi:hypothetical protein [Chengkuizengella marina]|uniref:Uncharacterized protein n=1 Tax=Chengkuizengella marina TaxID=2507566 RepID=A0A6N9Q057_9BACL|nr:hypothetical protein [Chengkuizengella marina]NBI28063.1 hypothetical protein [Chengkuizengella marina]
MEYFKKSNALITLLIVSILSSMILPVQGQMNMNVSSATEIEYKLTYSGVLNSNESEGLYKYEASGTGIDTLSLIVPNDVNYDVYIYDENLNQIGAGVNSTGELEEVYYRVSRGNIYYIVIISQNENYSLSDYTLKIEPYKFNLQTNYKYDKNGNLVLTEVFDVQKQKEILNSGLNYVEADMDTSVSLTSLEGRTLVNLLGNEGNIEEQGLWTNKLTTDISTSKFGRSSGIIDNSTGITEKTVRNSTSLDLSGKKILAGIWAKANSGTPNMQLYLLGKMNDIGINSPQVNSYVVDNDWKLYYDTFDLSSNTDDYWHFRVDVDSFGTSDDIINFDGAFVYEIKDTEESFINSLTLSDGQQYIEEMYPFVDGMQSITNPLFLIKGKNIFQHSDYALKGLTALKWYDIEMDIPMITNQSYTLSIDKNNSIFEGLQLINSDNSEFVEINDLTINNYGNITFTKSLPIRLRVKTDENGSYNLKNLMLNIGDEPLPFENPNEKTMNIQTSLHSNIHGDIKDRLYQNDTKMIVNRKIGYKELNGNDEYNLNFKEPDYTVVVYKHGYNTKQNLVSLIKDSGIPLELKTTLFNDMNQVSHLWDSGNLFISISNEDSGWEENYTPSNEDIQRYFNGWKYIDGSTWISKTGNGGTTDETSALSSMPNDYTPYQLQYELQNSVVEEIQIENQIMLLEGYNQLELRSSVIDNIGFKELNSSDKFEYSGKGSGYTVVTYKHGYNTKQPVISMTKYDREPLELNTTSFNDMNQVSHLWDSGNLFISISNEDSGWGENYTPSNEDIQRYFNGWKYTDSMRWVSVTGNGEEIDAQNSLSFKPSDYLPYRLIYQLKSETKIQDLTSGFKAEIEYNIER